MVPSTAFPLPRAVLFDMDGTLTEPMLDFPRIKREMGIGQRPILETLAEMDEVARKAAEIVLQHHEEQAARCSTLNRGCHELLDDLNNRGIHAALITRNSRVSVETVFRRHSLSISTLIAREDAPPMPHPAPLLLACQRLGIDRSQVWMVGDGQYDVEAGHAAGIRTIWLSHGRIRPFSAEPWLEVRELLELQQLLDRANLSRRTSQRPKS